MSEVVSLAERMLTGTKNIVVVGLSDKPTRASHGIARYLSDRGYHVVGVNPALVAKPVRGVVCHATLEAADQALRSETGRGIDLVNVFRAPEHVPAIVDEVIRLKVPYLWLQDGVRHAEAVARARAAGVQAIEDDCIYRWHLAL